MRLARPLSLAALLALAAAGPASGAAVQPVGVDDDFFDPPATQVAVGDTVDWSWAAGSVNTHNVVSRRNQIDRFRSPLQSGGGNVFPHTFKYPGRFSYICEVHVALGMKGTITVGTDDGIPPSLTHVSLSPKLAHRRVKLSFHLSERSVIRVSIKRSTKTVKRVTKVFSAGDRALRVSLRGLKLTRYAAYIQATDGWGHKSAKVKRRFRRI